MNLKKLISGFLTLTLLISLFPIPNAQAIKRTYPTDGYCTKYVTPTSEGGFGYDRIEVPNPLMSDYLEGLSANDAVEEMNRIKADHLCMQRADIEYMLTKITDETRRAQLQRELEDIIKLENEVKNKLKLIREREERISKFLETLRVLAITANAEATKNIIDKKMIILDDFQEEWKAHNKELAERKEERTEEVTDFFTEYDRADKKTRSDMKNEVYQRVLKQYLELKMRTDNEKGKFKKEITEALLAGIDMEDAEFDVIARQSFTDPLELSGILQAYREFKDIQQGKYKNLISAVIDVTFLQTDRLLRALEDILGIEPENGTNSASLIRFKFLTASGDSLNEFFPNSVERSLKPVKSELTEEVFKTVKTSMILTNALFGSPDAKILQLLKNSRKTDRTLHVIRSNKSLTSNLDALDKQVLNDIDSAYYQEHETAEKEKETIDREIQGKEQENPEPPFDPEDCAPIGNDRSVLFKEFGDLPVALNIIDCKELTSEYKMNKAINRAEAAKILYLLKIFTEYPDLAYKEKQILKKGGTPSSISPDFALRKFNNHFYDVRKDQWFADFVATLKDWGIISGKGISGEFVPAGKINNAESVKILIAGLLSRGIRKPVKTLIPYPDMSPPDKSFFIKNKSIRLKILQEIFRGYKNEAWYSVYTAEALGKGLGGRNNIYFDNGALLKNIGASTTRGDFLLWGMRMFMGDLKKEIDEPIEGLAENSDEEGEGDGEEDGEKRMFKISIKNVNIRKATNKDSDILKTIKGIKTEITVIGKAVAGEYVDKYKTDRWYPVKCVPKNNEDCKDKNNKSINKGYVLATLVHPEFIEFQNKGINCGSRRKIKNQPIERVVLHGTAGSSLSGALNAFNKNSCVGAHFYLGQDGKIVQIATVDKIIWHAGYGGSKLRKELDKYTLQNSYTSIGVEMANIGLYKDQSDENNKDIDTVFPDYWNMWKKGLHWGGFKNGNDVISIDSKKWQFYTEDQYKSLDKLISYIEESTGIPYQVSLYKNEADKNNSIAYYYHPLSPGDVSRTVGSDKYNKQKKVIDTYLKNIFSFRGVVDHHAHAGKWDAGPAFDICNENLNFKNINNFCNE